MHFPFTEVEVIWTLTFAALLVLLVVLLGRDRLGRFPLFTAGVVLAALEMLARRLLTDKLAPLNATEVFLTLADVSAVVTIFVVMELARRAFAGASPRAIAAGAVVTVAVAAGILVRWGPWPARATVFAPSLLGHLRLMQLFAEKGDLLNNLLFMELALLAILTGRRFHAGWRGHARQLLLGYSLVGLTQVTVRILWQRMANAGQPTSQAEFDHRMAMQDRLLNFNSILYLVVVVGWIACLWFDDPGYTPAAEPEPASSTLETAALPEEAPKPAETRENGKADPIAAALQRAIGHDAAKPTDPKL